MLIGARTIAWSGGEDKEEAMYKELYIQNLTGTITGDANGVFEIDFQEFGIDTLRYGAIGAAKCNKIVLKGISNFSKVNGSWPYQASGTISEIEITDGEVFNSGAFGSVGSACRTIRVRDFRSTVSSFGVLGLQGATGLRDFYITSRTAQAIKDLVGFPFATKTYNANIELVTFHGNDGNVVRFNGMEWVVEAASNGGGV